MTVYNKRKFLAFAASTIVGIILCVWSSVMAQNVSSDLLNLSVDHPNLTESYLTPNKLQLKEAWQAVNGTTTLLAPVKIGIIDTSVDRLHPEFLGEHVGLGTVGRVDFGSSTPNSFFTPDFHGTGVAGVIGANNLLCESFPLATSSLHMNGILSGVSRLNYVLELQTPPEVTLPVTRIRQTLFDNATAITKLAKRDTHIINISRAWPARVYDLLSEDFLAKKIENYQQSILFILSAANQGVAAETRMPARLGDNLDNVITVGAVNNQDERAIFTTHGLLASNFGDAVNIAAPGIGIYTPNLFTAPLDIADYQLAQGTSFSAPMVTGVAGLLKAINPALTPAQLKNILTTTADPIHTTDPDELSKTLGSACDDGSPSFRGCRLNAFKAVCHPDVGLNCEPSPAPVLNISASPRIIHPGGSSTITWSATGVESCIVTGPNGFSNTGLSGSASTGALTQVGTHTYILTCRNGTEETAETTVKVFGIIIIEQ